MRNSFDFALVNVAVFASWQSDTVVDCRVVLGAVAATPHRCLAAEQLLRGQALSPDLIKKAAKAAVADATPLAQNEYKIGLARQLVEQALGELV